MARTGRWELNLSLVCKLIIVINVKSRHYLILSGKIFTPFYFWKNTTVLGKVACDSFDGQGFFFMQYWGTQDTDAAEKGTNSLLYRIT